MEISDKEIMLRCLEMGVTLSSPSSHEREKIVANIGEELYKVVTAVGPTRQKPGPKPKKGTP